MVANQVEDGQFEGLKFRAGVNTQSHALGFVESQGDRGVAAVAPNPGLGLPTSTVVEAFDGGPLMSAWESGKLSRMPLTWSLRSDSNRRPAHYEVGRRIPTPSRSVPSGPTPSWSEGT